MLINHQSWLIIEKFTRLVSSVISTFLIARMLGVEKFGLYSYIISVITLIIPIANMGLDSILLRDFSQRPEHVAKIVTNAILLKLAGAFFAVFVLISILFLFKVSENIFWYCISTSIIFGFGIFNVKEQYLLSNKNGKYLAILTICISIGSLILKILTMIHYKSIDLLLAIFCLEIFTFNVVLIIIYNKKISEKYAHNISLAGVKQLFSDSWPLLFSGFCIAAYMRVDQLMIESLLDLEQLGIYSVAVKISEAWYFLPAVIATAAAPGIYRARETDQYLYNLAVEKLLRKVFWVSTTIGIVIYIFAWELVYYSAGVQYIDSVEVLRIHILGGIFLSIGVAGGKWIIAENYPRGALYKAMIGLMANLGLNFALIPVYGIYGAACGTVVAHFGANIVYDAIDPRLRPLLKLKIRALTNLSNKRLQEN